MDSPNQWNEHSWGRSQHLYITLHTDLAFAIGEAGGASSLHVHHSKANTFIVMNGTIELWGPGQSLIAQVGPGKAFLVSEGVEHRMVFLTDASLYELYYARAGTMLDLDDIERLEPGWKPGERKVVTRQEAMTDSAGNPLPRGSEFGKDSAV